MAYSTLNNIDIKALSKLPSEIDEVYKNFLMKECKLTSAEFNLLLNSPGKNIAEKIYNFYTRNKNSKDLLKQALIKKLNGIDLKGGMENYNLVANSINQLKTKIKAGSMKELIDFIQNDKGISLLFKWFGINKQEILGGQYTGRSYLPNSVNTLFGDISSLFKIKNNLSKLEIEISSNKDLIGIFSTKWDISKLDLSKLSTNYIFILSEVYNLIDNVRFTEKDIKTLNTILNKPDKEIDYSDIKFISNHITSFDNLVRVLYLLNQIGIIEVDRKKISKLKKLYLIRYAKLSVASSLTPVKKDINNGLLHYKEIYENEVDTFKLLSFLEVPKEKLKEMLNADTALRGIYYYLINFDNISKDYPGGPTALFFAIKKSIEDYKKTKWYEILPSDVKQQFDFISKLILESNSYSDYKEKLKLYSIWKKRAERLMILLDTYGKLLTKNGKGINPSDYKQLISYILLGNWQRFEFLFNKIYKNIKCNAEGSFETDGWEIDNLISFYGNDYLNSGLLYYETINFKNIFSEQPVPFLDNDTNFYNALEKLIKLCEKEGAADGGTTTVKERVLKYNIDELLIKYYISQNQAVEVKEDKNHNIIYYYEGRQLIFKNNGEVIFKGKGNEKLDALKDNFIEKNGKLIFKDLSIDIENGYPKGYNHRFRDLYPSLGDQAIDYFGNIKTEFRHLYLLISFYKLVGANIDYSLLNRFSTLSYLLFGKADYSKLGLAEGNDSVKDLYKKLENLDIEKAKDKYLADPDRREAVRNIIKKQWKLLPLWQRQLLAKKLGVNSISANSDIPGNVLDALTQKMVITSLLAEKTKYEYILFNTANNSFIAATIADLKVSFWERLFDGVTMIVKELVPIVIAEIVGTLVDLSGIGAGAGIAMQAWGLERAGSLALTAANWLFRYGVVEAGTYTLSSNLIHGNGLSFEGYGRNALFYLLPGVFAKGGTRLGSLFTSRLATESSGLSKFLWGGAATLGGIELTNYLIDGKIDINQLPYDALFLLLLHGTHMGLEKGVNSFYRKTGVNLKGIVWNPQERLKFRLNVLNPTFDRIKGVGKRVAHPILASKVSLHKLGVRREAIKELSSSLAGKEKVYDTGSLEGSLWLDSKTGTLYEVKQVLKSGKLGLKIPAYDVVEVPKLKDISSVILKDKDLLVVIDKKGNLLIKKGKRIYSIKDFVDKDGKIDPVKIEIFEERLKKLTPSSLKKITDSASFKEFSKFIEKFSNNPKLREEYLKELDRLNKLSEAEVRKLPIFGKVKEVIKEKLIKKGKSSTEADKLADKEAVSAIKASYLYAKNVIGSIFKFPFKVLGFMGKTAVFLLLVGGVGFGIDYMGDHKLDSIAWLENHFGSLAGAAGGYMVGKKVFGDSFLGKLVTMVAGSYLGKFIQEKYGADISSILNNASSWVSQHI